MVKQRLRLADGTKFRDGPNKLKRAELAAIGLAYPDDLGSQRTSRSEARHLLVQRSRRNLQRQPSGAREIASGRQHGTTAADIQNRGEIQKAFAFIVDPTCKNRNR